MGTLRTIILLASIVLLLAIGGVYSVSSTSPTDVQAEEEQQHIAQLSHYCYLSWQEYDWTMGEHGLPAKNNIAFAEGIKRICQVRAELFFEGYEVSPFIDPDSQHTIFPIVFMPDEQELKAVIRQNLPPLTVI